MQVMHFIGALVWYLLATIEVNADQYNITLSNNGPVVLGGTITFRVDLFEYNGRRPDGIFKYHWKDDALKPHEFETDRTSNTTSYWTISYPRDIYNVGIYTVEVIVSELQLHLWWDKIISIHTNILVSEFLNGDVRVSQPNKTTADEFVSSTSETNVSIHLRDGDLHALENASSVTTYWFIDCKYYGQTNDMSFLYNFTDPDKTHNVEGLVVASFDPPTTLPPPTTTEITTVPGVLPQNGTTKLIPISTSIASNVTEKPTSPSPPSTLPVKISPTTLQPTTTNISLPYICLNTSIVPPDPGKTYGHFSKKISVRAPIMNISVEGTHWIQPWDMLSLNVTCKGSGPFSKCLHFQQGKYNVTGNETCNSVVNLSSCNFSIIHYFLEPSVYTILIIMNNDVSKQIYPLTINIYKVTTKPQLSVIVVPVSCSLAAVVLIVFGIAYYIQSRARFTVEVADFDFGQSNPEMEYKTFGERLRDSFNNTIRPENKRISGYKHLSNPEPLQ